MVTASEAAAEGAAVSEEMSGAAEASPGEGEAALGGWVVAGHATAGWGGSWRPREGEPGPCGGGVGARANESSAAERREPRVTNRTTPLSSDEEEEEEAWGCPLAKRASGGMAASGVWEEAAVAVLDDEGRDGIGTADAWRPAGWRRAGGVEAGGLKVRCESESEEVEADRRRGLLDAFSTAAAAAVEAFRGLVGRG